MGIVVLFLVLGFAIIFSNAFSNDEIDKIVENKRAILDFTKKNTFIVLFEICTIISMYCLKLWEVINSR